MEKTKDFNLKNQDIKLILQYNFEDDITRYIDKKTDELIDLVKRIESNSELSHQLIQIIVEDYFGLNKGDLTKKTRKSDIVYPRHIAIYFSVNLNMQTKGSPCYTLLAPIYGYKLTDHASVIHGYRKIKTFLGMKNEAELRQHVEAIQKRLNTLTQ